MYCYEIPLHHSIFSEWTCAELGPFDKFYTLYCIVLSHNTLKPDIWWNRHIAGGTANLSVVRNAKKNQGPVCKGVGCIDKNKNFDNSISSTYQQKDNIWKLKDKVAYKSWE